MTILEQVQQLHTDALIWKSKKIWRQATNPDGEAIALNQIADMLMHISNDVKRISYISFIPKEINALNRKYTKNIAQTESYINELVNKSKSNSTDLVKAQLNELQNKLSVMKDNQVVDLSKTLLNNQIKDLIKQRKKSLKAKVEAKKYENAAITANDIGLDSSFTGDLQSAIRYGIYEEDNQYYVKGDKGWKAVSSFTINVHYLVRSNIDSAYRIITMINTLDIEQTASINTDDLTSVSSFRKFVNRYSNFSFTGNDSDLARINEYLQRDERHASQLNILGYNVRHNFWAWGNGILDINGEFPEYMPCDDFGMVTSKDGSTFYIPSASTREEFDFDAVGDVTPEKKFSYSGQVVTFNKWAKLHYEVHGMSGIIGQLWLCAALYRDLIFGNASIRRMPLLFLYGQPGSGKGVFATGLLSAFGLPQDAIMLESGGSTQKGILRRFAQFKNGVVWLDEYKNHIHKTMIGTIKQLYDGQSYTRATKSNDVRTESSPINASAIVSGQEMPTIEAAVLERNILLQFKLIKNRPQEQTDKFEKLMRLEAQGLGCLTNEIVGHRKIFSKNFYNIFRSSEKELRDYLIPMGCSERYVMNYAILLAIYDTLSDLIHFPVDRESLVSFLKNAAFEQNNITKDNNDVAKFWQVVEYMAQTKIITEGEDYFFNADQIAIRLSTVAPKYAMQLRMQGDANALPKSTLEHYLKSDKTLFIDHKKVRFPGSAIGPDNKRYGSGAYNAFVFDYIQLAKRYNIELLGDQYQSPFDNDVDKTNIF